MRKTLKRITMALALASLLSIQTIAAGYVLDFTSEGINDASAYTEANGEFTVVPEKSPRAAVSTLDGAEFYIKTQSAWGLVTLVNSDNYDETGLNGNGVKFRFDNGIEVTVLRASDAWGAPYKASYRVLADKTYNDGEYHKISIAKADGKWSVKFDGEEVIADMSNEDYQVIDSLLSGSAYVCFGANGGTDAITIKSAEVKSEEQEPTPPTGDALAIGIVIYTTAAAAVFLCLEKKRG